MSDITCFPFRFGGNGFEDWILEGSTAGFGFVLEGLLPTTSALDHI